MAVLHWTPKLWSCYPIEKDKTYTILKPKLQTKFYSLDKFSRYTYLVLN